MSDSIQLRAMAGPIQAYASAKVGMTHSDTIPFDHFEELALGGDSRICEVTIVHEFSIVGLIVIYKTPTGKRKMKHIGNFAGKINKATIKLVADEYIDHVSGRAGNFLDRIVIRTNKGQILDVGGDGGKHFDLNVPHGSAVCAFTGGIGGHLHNISVVCKPLYRWTSPVKSEYVGMTHGDTRPWDHLPNILSQGPITTFRIAEVHSLFDKYVVGLRLIYEVNGHRIEIEHFGSDILSPSNSTGTLVLDPDDYIVEVTGNAGNLVDRICFKTHKGKTVSWGGPDGHQFNISVPPGMRVVGFAGGTNGHLHNFGVYYN